MAWQRSNHCRSSQACTDCRQLMQGLRSCRWHTWHTECLRSSPHQPYQRCSRRTQRALRLCTCLEHNLDTGCWRHDRRHSDQLGRCHIRLLPHRYTHQVHTQSKLSLDCCPCLPRQTDRRCTRCSSEVRMTLVRSLHTLLPGLSPCRRFLHCTDRSLFEPQLFAGVRVYTGCRVWKGRSLGQRSQERSRCTLSSPPPRSCRPDTGADLWSCMG